MAEWTTLHVEKKAHIRPKVQHNAVKRTDEKNGTEDGVKGRNAYYCIQKRK